VKLLLDTHIAIWAIQDDHKLTDYVRGLISDRRNAISVSAASIWEIAIKFASSRGRPNDIPVSAPDAVTYFQKAGFRLLSVAPEHAVAVASLPALHKDPFDRLIVAQALMEPLRLVTHDRIVADYSDTILLV